MLEANVLRRRLGAYSEPKATAFGTAPPIPIPAKKRNIVNCSTLVMNMVSRVKRPNRTAQRKSIHLRPKRSASMPKPTAPKIDPARLALMAKPSALGFEWRNSAILGTATPIIV